MVDVGSPRLQKPVEGAVRLALRPEAGAPEFIDGFTPEPGPHRRKLRVALAMKGGVSLAVWIGGAVTELDVFRRIRLCGNGANAEAYLLASRDVTGDAYVQTHRDLIGRASRYARYLAARGYDAVEFDVLAGASAGGLNAVMYAVAQRVGSTTEPVLTLWQDSGDVWKLLRKASFRSIDSVLDGDHYFWGQMYKTLVRLHSDPARTDLAAAPTVTVDLSATILDGGSSSDRGIREGKAHFHFSSEPGLNRRRNIPFSGQPADQVENDLARLAYAARTTSSFPGAFEPALIYSGDHSLKLEPSPVDMSGAFHAHRHVVDGAVDPFRVVDGGVTDNVPIDRALRAVRSRASHEYVNRALIYLDPSPDVEFRGLFRPTRFTGTPPTLAPGPRRNINDPRSYFLGVIFSAVGRMIGRESKDDEIDDVEFFRRELFLEQGRDQLFAPIVEQPIDRADGPEYVTLAYARYRSVADLDLLTSVLTAPSLWQLTSYTDSRHDFRAWNRDELVRLPGELTNYFNEAPQHPGAIQAVKGGPQAAVDACVCALAWIREIEDAAFYDDGEPRFGLEQLDQAIAGRGFTRAQLRQDLHDVFSVASRARDEALAHVLSAADRLAGADPSGERDVNAQAKVPEAKLPHRLAATVREAWVSANERWYDGGRNQEAAQLWAKVGDIIAKLRVVSAMMDDRDGNGAAERAKEGFVLNRATEWSQSPWSGVGRTADTFLASDLAPLVAARGIPLAVSLLSFGQITAADTRSQLARFPSLLEAQKLSGYRSLLRLGKADAEALRSAGDGAEPLSESVRALISEHELKPRMKLGGMGLGNFAGFLSRDWRTNDWWWGRMDAAAGMLRFLDSLSTAGAEFPLPAGVTADSMVEEAQSHILNDWENSTTKPVAAHKKSPDFAGSLGVDLGGVSSLSPGYRVAVASRLSRLFVLGLVRGAGVLSPRRALFWLLRPLLVFVPAVFDAPRLAVILAVIAAPFVATGLKAEVHLGEIVGMAILASLTLIVLAASASGRWGRSKAVGRALGSRLRTQLREPIRRAAVAGAGLAIVAVLAVAAAFSLAIGSQRVGFMVWFLLVVGIVFATVFRFVFLVPRTQSGRSPVGSVLMYVLAIALLVAASIGAPAVMGLSKPLLAAITGGAVALLLSVGWLSGVAGSNRSAPAAIGQVLVLVFAAAAAAALPMFLTAVSVPTVVAALAAWWLWGTVVWWEPALFDGAYTPSDKPARRRSTAPSSEMPQDLAA